MGGPSRLLLRSIAEPLLRTVSPAMASWLGLQAARVLLFWQCSTHAQGRAVLAKHLPNPNTPTCGTHFQSLTRDLQSVACLSPTVRLTVLILCYSCAQQDCRVQ